MFFRIREALDYGKQHALWLPWHAAAIGAVTLGYAVFWGLQGDPEDHLFFREGGAIDWLSTVYLAVAMSLAGLAGWLGRRLRQRSWWLWFLCCAGLAFLIMDERFQLHEYELRGWLQEIVGHSPLVDPNDLVLLLYGILAALLGWWVLPEILRHRGLFVFLGAGFGFYSIHNTLDLFNVANHWLGVMAEETAKVLCGAYLALAFLHLVLALVRESADRDASGSDGPAPGRIFATAVIALALLPLGALAGLDDPDRLFYRWGHPGLWVASICLAASATLVALRGPTERDTATERRLWYVTAAAAALLAFDGATIACGYRFTHEDVPSSVPNFLTDGITVLSHPTGLRGLVALGWIALLVILARRTRQRAGAIGFSLVLAAVATGADVVVSYVALERMPVLGVVAGASLLVASISRSSLQPQANNAAPMARI